MLHVMVLGHDSALLMAVTELMEFHLPEVRVHPFSAPYPALDQLKKKDVATFVAELDMKQLDAFELVKEAKARRPDVPVILLSDYIDSTVASHVVTVGTHDVLLKPFSREDFVTAVTLALNMYDRGGRYGSAEACWNVSASKSIK
jgi:DNA-binding NarL/FixJ family response regulator